MLHNYVKNVGVKLDRLSDSGLQRKKITGTNQHIRYTVEEQLETIQKTRD